ncbi:MAG: uroporphyrinogen decarboxylase, partial [Oscillospiraceae bacterium]|nr:uroporphyrinogen decarboxylase [Oscillospiraceae bacterium]
MTYEELKVEAVKYPDRMSDFERITAYGRGEEVDHIPTTLSIGENQATWYGYTLSQFRNSADVQMDVDRKAMEDFGCGTIKARTLLYPPAVGKAFGSEFASPENGGEYINGHILKDYS